MIARGKREARRPWLTPPKNDAGLKGRNIYYALSGLRRVLIICYQGRRPDKSGLAPGYHIAAPLALPRSLFVRCPLLPATAQCLIQLDHGQQFVAACKGEASLGFKEFAVGVERVQQRRDAARVAQI